MIRIEDVTKITAKPVKVTYIMEISIEGLKVYIPTLMQEATLNLLLYLSELLTWPV